MRAFFVFVAWSCLAGVSVLAQEQRSPRESAAGSGKQLCFDVLIADVPAESNMNPAGHKELAQQIVAMERQGKLSNVTHIPLATLDQSPATIQFGKQVAVEVSRSQTSRGPVRSFGQQSGGTLVQITPALQENGTILVECTIEQTRIPPEAQGDEAVAASTIKAHILTAKTTLRVLPGIPVLVGGQKTVKGEEKVQTYMVLTATVEKGSE